MASHVEYVVSSGVDAQFGGNIYPIPGGKTAVDDLPWTPPLGVTKLDIVKHAAKAIKGVQVVYERTPEAEKRLAAELQDEAQQEIDKAEAQVVVLKQRIKDAEARKALHEKQQKKSLDAVEKERAPKQPTAEPKTEKSEKTKKGK